MHLWKDPGSRFANPELDQRSGRPLLATIAISLGALFAVFCPSAFAHLPAAPNAPGPSAVTSAPGPPTP